MAAAVQQLLLAFEALTEAEQHEAAVEILRRAPSLGEVWWVDLGLAA
jgi:hypothetical protein